jgi:hypothetical protein
MITQNSMKSQDIVVALKIAVSLKENFTYSIAGGSLGLSASRVHASVQMLVSSRLAVGNTREGITINRARLLELIVYGVPYFFPPVIGGPTRGVPTISGLQEMKEQFVASEENNYVWPDANGEDRGYALAPLHSCVLKAIRGDEELYRTLMAVDVLRVGSARERDFAVNLLRKMLA